MEQSVLTRHNLHEASVRHHRTNGSFVDLAHFGNSYDGANLADGGIDALLVGS